jgi:hypothetical protein
MTEKNYKESWTLWQTAPEDSVEETPLIIEAYGDVVSIKCNGESVNLNYESIPEFIKLLKKIKKDYDTK